MNVYIWSYQNPIAKLGTIRSKTKGEKKKKGTATYLYFSGDQWRGKNGINEFSDPPKGHGHAIVGTATGKMMQFWPILGPFGSIY